MDKTKCIGCYNDIYNHGAGGAKECWMFKTAKLVRKIEVHVDQRPPYHQKSRFYPTCYSKQRYAYIVPRLLNKKGYWK